MQEESYDRKNGRTADGGHVLRADGAAAGRAVCGTEIAAWTERCTEGRVRLGPGTLYTILGRFLEEGFIQETSVQGRQRNYRLTEKGQQAYRNERLRLRLCLADAEREDAGERL